MRIQTRFFLGIAILVLALMACQWWLHLRQLRAVERQLVQVATSVSRDMLSGDLDFVVDRFVANRTGTEPTEIKVIALAGEAAFTETHEVRVEQFHQVLRSKPGAESASVADEVALAWVNEMEAGEDCEDEIILQYFGEGAAVSATHRVKIEVIEDEGPHGRFLFVTSDSGVSSKIPIPVSPAVEEISATQRQGLGLSAGLLVVGLVASGVMANRMARPLRDLAASAERLGEGELGDQVDVTATGEVGDLQRAFNHMSQRLAELEKEREAWLEREHLAQLGDLSRGLAHTLRNPLNTLGLAVEELASASGGQEQLVMTARGQIGRIDRWLRSFLALGAGDAAEVEQVNLAEMARATVLEKAQLGHDIRVVVEDELVTAAVVDSALRAAVVNLVENAVEAVPATAPVEVRVFSGEGTAVIEITDRGPGIPEEVQARLFSPHVTTKTGGSGMGMFLARQLIVNMHGGRLVVASRDGGGTTVTIHLPASEDHGVEA